MVYIYKKTIGGKQYYYLRVSERKGKKVIVKDIAYLGNNIKDVQKALDKLPKYKDKIRKAHRTITNFLQSNYYLEKLKKIKLKKDNYLEEKFPEIEACKLHFNEKFQKLDNLSKQEIFKNFIIEFSFNTASIEGNTITLKEARDLLEEGLTPKNKTLREIYDLQNTEKVFNFLLETKKEISHEFIIDIHSKLMERIDNRKGYRTGDVRVIKAKFKSTPARYVKTDMDLLINFYKENKNKLNPLVLAIIIHHKFEKIHPFFDGNGRTGRMLLNYILLKNNYPPLIIHKKSRGQYLDALRKADSEGINSKNKDAYFELIHFVASEMSDYYWDIFLY